MSAIQPQLLDKLEPGYRAFVESNPPKLPTLHGLTWSPAFRKPPPGGPPDMGSEPPIPVGSQRTINLGDFSIQTMIPDGERPPLGWPAVLFLHAGGWVFGDAMMENGLLSRANVVVVSVDYRLAPEHLYPTAVNDSWSSLIWLYSKGPEELGVDPTRIALMGRSAGGNLAAVIAQRASLSAPRIPVALQILLSPVIDTTYTMEDRSRWTQSMVENVNNFAFPTPDMLWLRDRYLPNPDDRLDPEASPNLQENKAAYEGIPTTLIILAELDTLRDDGEMYAQKLKQFGVSVTIRLLKGLTHFGASTDRVSEVARASRDRLIEYVKDNLHQ